MKAVKIISHSIAVLTIAVMSVLLLDSDDLPVTLASLAAKNLAYWNSAISVVLVYFFMTWVLKIDIQKVFDTAEDSNDPLPKTLLAVGIFGSLCYLAGSTYGV